MLGTWGLWTVSAWMGLQHPVSFPFLCLLESNRLGGSRWNVTLIFPLWSNFPGTCLRVGSSNRGHTTRKEPQRAWGKDTQSERGNGIHDVMGGGTLVLCTCCPVDAGQRLSGLCGDGGRGVPCAHAYCKYPVQHWNCGVTAMHEHDSHWTWTWKENAPPPELGNLGARPRWRLEEDVSSASASSWPDPVWGRCHAGAPTASGAAVRGLVMGFAGLRRRGSPA